MILYKFRPLGNETDLTRAKDILNTGKFWCSRFYELNDPMEGVFITKGFSDELFNQKNGCVICSFSAEEAFKNPAMWGYYANAFKGIAIEIKVKDDDVRKINYNNKLPSIEDGIEKIITSKFKSWKHEAEYRFIGESTDSQHKIGEITAVYFVNPYNVINRSQICENSATLRCYYCLKKQLIYSVKNRSIGCFDIEIKDNGEVTKNNQTLQDISS